MVIDFKTDSTGDLVFDGQNDLVLVEGDDELMQCVADILTTNLGEWFLNPSDHGFPLYEVLGDKFDREEVTDRLVAAVLQESRIAAVEEITWEFDRKERKLTGTFRIVKRDGEVIQGGF